MGDPWGWFSVHREWFRLFGYAISPLELVGTLVNLWSVYLVAKGRVWAWPVGIVAVILFGVLFFQIRLYSDCLEQIYFLVTGFYGWWVWAGQHGPGGKLDVRTNSPAVNAAWGAGILAVSWGLGAFMTRVHVWWPILFPQPASYPYWDAGTTIMGFAAQSLMTRKRLECWLLWIAVDLASLWLYYAQGVVFVSLLYLVFLGLAVQGFIQWRRLYAGAVSGGAGVGDRRG